jgi:ribonuclease HI
VLKVYSDGGSRGNPGPSATAFMVLDENDRILKRHCSLLGKHTNNQAEYEALISALKCVLEFSKDDVTCFLDSELVVKQLNGEYRVRNPELKDLCLNVRELQKEFNSTSFVHVPRTNKYMQEVDSMVNQALDKSAQATLTSHRNPRILGTRAY